MDWMIDMNEEVKDNKMFGLQNGTMENLFTGKKISAEVACQMKKWKKNEEFRFSRVTFEMPIRH